MLTNTEFERAICMLSKATASVIDILSEFEKIVKIFINIATESNTEQSENNAFVDNMEAYIDTLPREKQDEARLILEDLKKMAQENGGFADIRVTSW